MKVIWTEQVIMGFCYFSISSATIRKLTAIKRN